MPRNRSGAGGDFPHDLPQSALEQGKPQRDVLALYCTLSDEQHLPDTRMCVSELLGAVTQSPECENKEENLVLPLSPW